MDIIELINKARVAKDVEYSKQEIGAFMKKTRKELKVPDWMSVKYWLLLNWIDLFNEK